MTEQPTQQPVQPGQTQAPAPTQAPQPPTPPAPPARTQTAPTQLLPEKKKLGKQPLILLIILLLLLAGGGLLYASGIIKRPLKPSTTQPEGGPGSVTGSGEAEAQKSSATITTDKELPKDKYLKDTDNDGFPDFLEVGSGYDPNVVDCAKETNCQASVGINPKSENNVLFILDSSGSMAGQVSGQQKMQVAKQAISSYIDKVPESVKAGLMVYGHKGSNNQKDKAVSCVGIEVLYPLGIIDKEAFKAKIASFQPTGWTPIADSFKKARDEVFVGKEKDNNSIILVSDGIETCEGDPCGVARELKGLGISPRIDVIGFDVDSQAKAQLQCIARVTNGQYFDARTAEEFNQAFEQLQKRTEEFEKVALCLNKNFESFMDCMNKQILASIDYLNKEKIAALDAGDQEKVDELDKIVARLDKKYEQWLEDFESGYTSHIKDLIKDYQGSTSDDLNNLEDLEKKYQEEYKIQENLTP